MQDDTLDLNGGSPALPERTLAGRYTLERELAIGGQATVWLATRDWTGERVVVKRYRGSPLHLELARREIAVLRWLRLPGVVPIVDDGRDEAGPYAVMEYVEGTPFLDPAAPTPSWEAVRPALVDLLGTIARLHATGLIHRDLKPGNILLRPGGSPVLLDFGTVQDRTVDDDLATSWATARYAAPEQLAMGRADGRTDLYALGVMLYTSFSGRPVHEVPAAHLRAGILPPEPPPLAGLAPGLPPDVAALVDRLVAPRPEHRPASAEEVLDALRGPAPAWLPPGLPRATATSAELRALFVGPDRFHHLAEDAASLLRAGTSGHPGALAEKLADWLESGWARREGDRVRVDRPALERLRVFPLLSDGRGRMLVPSRLASEALRLGRAARDGLDLASAEALFALGLAAARSIGDTALEVELGGALAEAALVQDPVAARRAQAELERAPHLTAELHPVAELLRIAATARPSAADRAAFLALEPHADERIEAWRVATRAELARRQGPEAGEAELRAQDAWARGSPLRMARVDGWRGNLRYDQGRYDEAAELHRRAADAKPLADGRLGSLMNAVSALLEAGDLAAAERTAQELADVASHLRHADAEARAWFLVRNARYRARRVQEPDLEAVAATRGLPAYAAGMVLLTEAVLAWDRGRTPLAADLAAQAAATLTRGSVFVAATFARALGWAWGPDAPLPDDVRAAASASPVVGIRAQIGAVLTRRGVEVSNLSTTIAAWEASLPPRRRSQRAELLSPAECSGN